MIPDFQMNITSLHHTSSKLPKAGLDGLFYEGNKAWGS